MGTEAILRRGTLTGRDGRFDVGAALTGASGAFADASTAFVGFGGALARAGLTRRWPPERATRLAQRTIEGGLAVLVRAG